MRSSLAGPVVAAALAAVAALPACGTEDAAPAAARTAPIAAPADRPCSTRAEGPRPIRFGRPGDVVIGPVALMMTPIESAEELAAYRVYRGRGGYSVKVGVSVRAGVRAALVVRPPARSWVTQSVRSNGAGQHAVTFQACDADRPAFSYAGIVGEATGFAHAFRLTRPGCVPLEVRVAGRPPVRTTVPFGVRRC